MALAKDGIFEEAAHWGWVKCTICGKEMRNHAFSRAAHGKKHVKAGEAVERKDYGSYDGPRTYYVAAP